MVGGALTYGFWKSFVKANKGRDWRWNDKAFQETVIDLTFSSLAIQTDALMARTCREDEQAVNCLDLLRAAKPIPSMNAMWFMDLQFVTSIAREKDSRQIAEVLVVVEFAAERQKIKLFHDEGTAHGSPLELLDEWIDARRPILDSYGIKLSYQDQAIWEPPSDHEIRRLAWIGNLPILEDFGPHEHERAVAAYRQGDIGSAVGIFQAMLTDREDADIRNNIGYCLCLMGRFEEAAAYYEGGAFPNESDSCAIWRHNQGLLACLRGYKETGLPLLKEALARAEKAIQDGTPTTAMCMMLLQPGAKSVTSRDGLPVEAAALLNLHLLGVVSLDEVKLRLRERYPKDYEGWLTWLS